MAPSRWGCSSPSSAGTTGRARVRAQRSLPPGSSHPGRALQDSEGRPSTPAPPGSFPETREPSDHIEKSLPPNASASQKRVLESNPAGTRHRQQPGEKSEPRAPAQGTAVRGAPGKGSASIAFWGAHLGTPGFPRTIPQTQPQGQALTCRTGKEGGKSHGSQSRLQNSRSPLQTE